MPPLDAFLPLSTAIVAPLADILLLASHPPRRASSAPLPPCVALLLVLPSSSSPMPPRAALLLASHPLNRASAAPLPPRVALLLPNWCLTLAPSRRPPPPSHYYCCPSSPSSPSHCYCCPSRRHPLPRLAFFQASWRHTSASSLALLLLASSCFPPHQLAPHPCPLSPPYPPSTAIVAPLADILLLALLVTEVLFSPPLSLTSLPPPHLSFCVIAILPSCRCPPSTSPYPLPSRRRHPPPCIALSRHPTPPSLALLLPTDNDSEGKPVT